MAAGHGRETAPESPDGPLLGLTVQGRKWLWETCVRPWQEAEAKGIGVMVGEWDMKLDAARNHLPADARGDAPRLNDLMAR